MSISIASSCKNHMQVCALHLAPHLHEYKSVEKNVITNNLVWRLRNHRSLSLVSLMKTSSLWSRLCPDQIKRVTS